MRSSTAAIVASLCLATPALAQKAEVKIGPEPSWVTQSPLLPVPENSGGLLFVRRQDILVHLDERGQANYNGFRIKILHQNALQMGNLSIAWSPESGSPVVHALKIHRGDQTIDVLKLASFEVMRREEQLEQARLDGMLSAVLRVPDLRVGDEIEFNVTTRMDDPTLGSDNSGIVFLLPQPPPGRYQLGISWIDGQQPKLKLSPDMEKVAARSDRSVAFRFDNPAILKPPQDSPPRFQWQRTVEFSDFADWPSISRHFLPLYEAASKLGKDSAVRKEAARIAAANPDPLQRAKAALKLVQQDVRYIYVGLNGGNHRPASADETWQRRYGDCKGKTALLLALLAEMGISAQPVLVHNSGNDDGLDERLPNPGMFDHVLVRAVIAGSPMWLDGTLPPVVPPSPETAIPYRFVLPLTAAGAELERLPWHPAKRPDEINLYEIDARAGFDLPAQITVTTIKRGIAGLQQQVELSAISKQDLLASMQQSMIGDTWQTIDTVDWRYDEAGQASILVISGSGAVDWDDDGDGARSLTLPGGGFSPPERRIRPAGQPQDLPFYSKPEFDCRVTTVRLPTATQARHWSFNSTFDVRYFGANYYRAMALKDGSIRMIRGLRVEKPEIDAVSARTDNARIAKFDNSMASISYDPTSTNQRMTSQDPVPATYEGDWTANDAACLSPATVR